MTAVIFKFKCLGKKYKRKNTFGSMLERLKNLDGQYYNYT